MANIKITDHAMLRYIERFMEIDIEQLRDQISTSLSKAHDEMKPVRVSGRSVAYEINGHLFFIKTTESGPQVITVLSSQCFESEKAAIAKRKAAMRSRKKAARVSQISNELEMAYEKMGSKKPNT